MFIQFIQPIGVVIGIIGFAFKIPTFLIIGGFICFSVDILGFITGRLKPIFATILYIAGYLIANSWVGVLYGSIVGNFLDLIGCLIAPIIFTFKKTHRDNSENDENIQEIKKTEGAIAHHDFKTVIKDSSRYNKTDMKELVKEDKEAIRKDQNKVNPTEALLALQWFSKGYEAESLKLYDKVIEYYTKAIQINPKYADAYTRRGIAYDNKGLYDDAIEDFTKAIKIDPKLAVVYNSRGGANAQKGLYDEAIEDYTKAIQINPNYAIAYCNRGIAYYSKGSDELCISNLKKAADLEFKGAKQKLKEFFNIDY